MFFFREVIVSTFFSGLKTDQDFWAVYSLPNHSKFIRLIKLSIMLLWSEKACDSGSWLYEDTNNQIQSSVYSGLPKDLLIINIFPLTTPHHIPVPLIAEQSDTQYLIFSNPKSFVKRCHNGKGYFPLTVEPLIRV